MDHPHPHRHTDNENPDHEQTLQELLQKSRAVHGRLIFMHRFTGEGVQVAKSLFELISSQGTEGQMKVDSRGTSMLMFVDEITIQLSLEPQQGKFYFDRCFQHEGSMKSCSGLHRDQDEVDAMTKNAKLLLNVNWKTVSELVTSLISRDDGEMGMIYTEGSQREHKLIFYRRSKNNRNFATTHIALDNQVEDVCIPEAYKFRATASFIATGDMWKNMTKAFSNDIEVNFGLRYGSGDEPHYVFVNAKNPLTGDFTSHGFECPSLISENVFIDNNNSGAGAVTGGKQRSDKRTRSSSNKATEQDIRSMEKRLDTSAFVERGNANLNLNEVMYKGERLHSISKLGNSAAFVLVAFNNGDAVEEQEEEEEKGYDNRNEWDARHSRSLIVYMPLMGDIGSVVFHIDPSETKDSFRTNYRTEFADVAVMEDIGSAPYCDEQKNRVITISNRIKSNLKELKESLPIITEEQKRASRGGSSSISKKKKKNSNNNNNISKRRRLATVDHKEDEEMQITVDGEQVTVLVRDDPQNPEMKIIRIKDER